MLISFNIGGEQGCRLGRHKLFQAVIGDEARRESGAVRGDFILLVDHHKSLVGQDRVADGERKFAVVGEKHPLDSFLLGGLEILRGEFAEDHP